ncbi:MAG TPA: CBS domain-containing protein [Candidatus Binataceae bacterium]|jgi:CBS domain-containing protein|nr:CBS domain-containing protein [Candidatus Binataceae bacterium]
MTAKVSDVLNLKGPQVVTVNPEMRIDTVAEILTRNRIGAVPVIDSRRHLIGIISERDIIHGISRLGPAVLSQPVDALMTREVTTCNLDDPIVELMEIMTHRRIRHLPVVEADALCGIVSIGDVVKQRLSEAQFELEQLRQYVSQ